MHTKSLRSLRGRTQRPPQTFTRLLAEHLEERALLAGIGCEGTLLVTELMCYQVRLVAPGAPLFMPDPQNSHLLVPTPDLTSINVGDSYDLAVTVQTVNGSTPIQASLTKTLVNGDDLTVTAKTLGSAGNSIVVNFTASDTVPPGAPLFGSIAPSIAVSGKTINVTVYNVPNRHTVLDQVIDAINNDPAAGTLVT